MSADISFVASTEIGNQAVNRDDESNNKTQ